MNWTENKLLCWHCCMHDCEDKDAVLLHNGSMGMQGFMLGSSGMQAGVFKAES